MKSLIRLCALAGGALAGVLAVASGTVSAQTITLGAPSVASVVQGTAQAFTVAVNYTAGGSAVGYQADFTIPAAFTVTSTNGDGVCAVGNPAAGVFRASDFDAGLATLPSGTVCTLNVTIGATAAVGSYNFSVCSTGTGACASASAATAAGATIGLTTTLGAAFTVTAPVANAGPTLTAGTPASGSTTTVAGGTQGAVVNSNITFAVAGGSGTGTTALACTAGAGGATISSGTPQTIAVGGTAAPVVVRYVLTAAAQTTIITCTATPVGGAVANFTYTFNAPAGAAIVVAPAILVPVNSTWMQLALVLLVLTVGGFAFAMRRNG